MEEKEKKDKKRAGITTVVVHALLLLVFIFFGLKYYEPKPEEGIAINFGNTDLGGGEIYQPSQAAMPKSQPEQSKPETAEKPAESSTENVQTQDVVDAPALETSKSEEEPEPEEEPKEEETPAEETEKPAEEQPENTEPSEPEKPSPSKELQDLLNNTENSDASGQGETKGSGDQGDPAGDPNSNNYQGDGGGGNGSGNYLLGNRAAMEKPRPDYPCEEEGRVVVKIVVDRNGNVKNATAGGKIPNGPATTTTSSCLYGKAEAAALRTTWQADAEAPPLQTGYIIYNFFKQ